MFDAVDVVLAMLNDPSAERWETYRLNDWLLKSKRIKEYVSRSVKLRTRNDGLVVDDTAKQ